ncbi:hypothetical protein [Psychroflexus tropicus]|uniref:hypothetical protein n=1 Tax=Psychroflexus tropicus TaxID=197345 RepID=UPI00036BCE24|nr:hypothetical protein [Psychroflexus tropicus]
MKTTIKLLSLVFVIFSISCQQGKTEEAKAFDKQMEETIKIHDDVMPRMSKINTLITELETQKEELQKAEEVDVEKLELHNNAIANLKQAHDLMMSWMKNFSDSFSRTEINRGLETQDKDSIMAKMRLLDAQYKSAEEMQKSIAEAIENAQIILSK